jgi:hypothetical protein
MRRLSILMLLVTMSFAQGDLKTYFEQLPQAKPSAELFDTALKVSDQLKALPQDEIKDLIPLVFKAIAADTNGTQQGALALFTISRRSDSSDLLKPYMKEIRVLLNSPDGRLKATAGVVLQNMNPTPPEAVDMLLEVANGNGPLNQRIDALSALVGLANRPKDKVEAAAIRILKDPKLDSHMRLAAIHASAYRDSSDDLVDVIAGGLDDPDWQVRMQAVLSMRGFGPRAIGKYHSKLAKLANDKDEQEPVRTMAQNTLDCGSREF